MERLPVHKICDYCEWYEPGKEDRRTGYCRRYPFEIDRLNDDWCGEYRFDPNQKEKSPPGTPRSEE